MKTKPWVAINLMNNQTIGRFESEAEAIKNTLTTPAVEILYRPRAKRKRSRTFP